MASIVSISRTILARRRKKLRKKRLIKLIQAIWRTVSVTSLAGGLLWIAIQPNWVLKTPKDVVITGNQLLSAQEVQSLLVLSYPQSLWKIEPSRIARSLQQQPSISQATVSRRLFPPGLVVQLQERTPVAIAQMRREQANSKNANTKVTMGLLDANGVWIPLKNLTSLNSRVKLPTLKVIGSPEQYRSYWSSFYEAISQTSLKVTEIDWQDPTNLIIKTELGLVHLGTPSPQLPEQIKVLAQIRHLPSQLNPNEIEYIDLKNPEHLLVQMNQKNRKPISKPSKKNLRV
ncbi:MAG: FtsQ-type POTRA domain-containing protein [Pelatocladus maniniholoensis HA4357-MV3]|jgi:cell division protein FtsQ|uniref:FtsQ-type POTRA domain-containing protein n=1 Tax=Pelatocladus maniniholoensis HA4357-MV3 TaxID=1117104 RepID=A0A9E3H6Z1_9NOST|nr:FtsQ-type POTRA domain-containing protein [Pelatocladus maniniholoensis HA4357-MV3]BAZ65837.1 polypeptide-transport-associated domain-containing protein FtsQ-type [Fischerella sp. NIES-4106]